MLMVDDPPLMIKMRSQKTMTSATKVSGFEGTAPHSALRFQRCLNVFVAALISGCSNVRAPIESDTPIHLEEHLKSALVESAEPPTEVPNQVDWIFADGRAKWRPLRMPTTLESDAQSRRASGRGSTVTNVDDALRLSLSEATRFGETLIGGVFSELDDWNFDEWGMIVLRARTHQPVKGMLVLFELDGDVIPREAMSRLMHPSEIPPMFSDGVLLTYAFPVRRPEGLRQGTRWTRLGIAFAVSEESSIDIVSVSAVPSGEELSWASTISYRDSYGVASESRADSARRALYAHTPARLTFRVVVPEAGRLDFGLGVVRDDLPVTFRITVQPDQTESQVLFEETYADRTRWSQHSIDLAPLAGRTASLIVEAMAEREGTVALWGAPTLSGIRRAQLPNIIFYVIDGAGADFMSVYGYERRTTPHLEELAAEGAVFERAYSNATWTQPSTASFTTSLHHSVLRGFRPGSSPVPPGVTTVAEHLHAAGYLTTSLTTNPTAGRIIGPRNGADVLLVDYAHDSTASSAQLHEDFWRFREHYPAEPFWVHFQTTDVHPPYGTVPPFAGRYVSAERRAKLTTWNREVGRGVVGRTNIFRGYREELGRLGIDAQTFYDGLRGLYDEAMEHQDYQLGRLVERLKARGEWQRTLLIIAADHGHPAGTFARFGRGLLDPEPPDWEGALFGAFNTHIPLIFVWPDRIAGGQRFSQPVSMIDILPTVLDLVGLPPPDLTQGQSLAPLLLGEEGFKARPVILDEFRHDPGTGELIGNIEIVDGRWGASLEIGPTPLGADPRFGRHAVPAAGRGASPYFSEVPRLLLYDLSSDPFAVHSVNERYPALVEKYSGLLLHQWKAHQALAKRFQPAEAAPLTPDELRALRSLGYIR